MLFECSVLLCQFDEVIWCEVVYLCDVQQMMFDFVLKDLYIFDFFGFNDYYFECDFEDVILCEMEQFFLEFGVGFIFVVCQKWLLIDDDDFYFDLLFYNCKFKCFVVIELKFGFFKVEYKSQMELYLCWFVKYEQELDEVLLIGIILCVGKK